MTLNSTPTKAFSKVTTADYARAEQFMPYSTAQLLLHTVETPTWLSDGKLWYRTRMADGPALVLVDPTCASRQVIFHAQHIAQSMPTLALSQLDTRELPLNAMALSDDGSQIWLDLGSSRWQYNRANGECSSLPTVAPYAVRSPDGKQEVFIREHDLWVRDTATRHETRLTADGVPDCGYATNNCGDRHSDRPVVRWSPDSKRLATFRQDQRGVGEMHLVSTQRGHPVLQSWKYPMAGDFVIPRVHRVIVDLEQGSVTELKMEPDLVRSAAWFGLAHQYSGELDAQWSMDGTQLAFISMSRDHKHARLRTADAQTGTVRDVIEERSATFYQATHSFWHAIRAENVANWRCLHTSNELIWYSSRSGWSHLYLYDLLSGQLKRQLTAGDWNVVNVLRVDERRRLIYFLAVGREPGRHPYFEHLYCVGFDGEGFSLLTPEDATHDVSIAPSGEYFVDSYSRPNEPAVSVVREARGNLVQVLETCNVSRLAAVGWRPPLPITVKARDGSTDLYGLLFRPSSFDDGRKYPIINAIYSGPILGSVIPEVSRCAQWGAFSTVHGLLGDAQSLAELGFIVVMIDGLGTPMRSRAFREATYAQYGDSSLADQVAAMKQLAQRHHWIDIRRAGIYGHSHGGYAAARAMLMFPDFFKVGVAISGNHDLLSYQDEYGEKFMGLREVRPDGTSNYDQHSNIEFAHRLKGRLLLVHGTLDDCVSPGQTLLLVQALIEANKDFDLLMLPNQTHAVEAGDAGRYMIRRYWDYFVRHLLGAEPPLEYRMRDAVRRASHRVPSADGVLSLAKR